MVKDILYIASQSQPRQQLLQQARIPFKILSHKSNEQINNVGMSFAEYVLAIAQSKMHSLTLPTRESVGEDHIFVVTADTLIRNPSTNAIFSKPIHRDHAVEMLRAEHEGPVEVMTGCCVDKLLYCNGKWERGDGVHWSTSSMVEFFVDSDCIDTYLSILPIALQCSGAGVIEDHGLSYLKSINGSYSAAIGLPLYELRQALKKLGFKF